MLSQERCLLTNHHAFLHYEPLASFAASALESGNIANRNNTFPSTPLCFPPFRADCTLVGTKSSSRRRRSATRVSMAFDPSSLPDCSATHAGIVVANGDGGIKPRYAEIVVVRHGETSSNVARILQGHLDPELNEIGRKQAAVVAVRLSKEKKFAAIYSSDLKRAAETAQIISTCCSLPEVVLDPALRERCLGDLQGLTMRDAAKQNPKAYNIFLSSKEDEEIPGGGESVNQVHQRCTSALEKIARKHIGKRVLVVTHSGILREFHKRANSGTAPGHGGLPNTSVNVFFISSDEKDWIMKTWGDISHLREDEFIKDSLGGDSIRDNKKIKETEKDLVL